MALPPESLPESRGAAEDLDAVVTDNDILNRSTSVGQEPGKTLDLADSEKLLAMAASQMPDFVSENIFAAQQQTSSCRQNVGLLMCTLMRKGVVSGQHFLDGVARLVHTTHDSPPASQVWLHLAQTIVPVVSSEMVGLSELHRIAGARQLLAAVLELLVAEKGQDWIDSQWNVSGTQWADFLGAPIEDCNKLTVISKAKQGEDETTANGQNSKAVRILTIGEQNFKAKPGEDEPAVNNQNSKAKPVEDETTIGEQNSEAKQGEVEETANDQNSKKPVEDETTVNDQNSKKPVEDEKTISDQNSKAEPVEDETTISEQNSEAMQGEDEPTANEHSAAITNTAVSLGSPN